MRINRYIAHATGMSRRTADRVIAEDRVRVNDQPTTPGVQIGPSDQVKLDGKALSISEDLRVVVLNKPTGYVVSRVGQGSKTIYELLPPELHHLKPVGRLDKESSGLLLLTDDGQLAHRLTHPSSQKSKIYEIALDAPLRPTDQQKIEQGIQLEDGVSKLQLSGKDQDWVVTMHEGRNRQIRRTFTRLGYIVTKLHRTHFGAYTLQDLSSGQFMLVE
jgi:23S rRNA pseudouridine2605 synthase